MRGNPRCMPKTHGLSNTAEWKSWQDVITRCTCPSATIYPYYGGRGIEVVEEWRPPHGFLKFLAHVGHMPMPGCTIERIDVNGHYEPGNVRWETAMHRQARNKSTTWRAPDGTPVADLCDAVGLPYSTVIQRVRKLGWTLDAALSTPARKDSRRRPMPIAGRNVSELVGVTCPCCGHEFYPGPIRSTRRK